MSLFNSSNNSSNNSSKNASKSMQDVVSDAASQDEAALNLARVRRRFLGALILLLLAAFVIPFFFDPQPRPWGDDVLIKIPKPDTVYKAPEQAKKP